ncbi:hypothetical protein ACF3MZ_17515 [Paenibacillaceae bacterium WGS1546]|uniref:hypothetical protein n=1 Tax=Cohnella sp. WGS1546 TaxID=3366810 RepID=UPI00372D698A
MSNKNINQLFEALTPKIEQKETMFQRIVAQSQEESRRRGKFPPLKRSRSAILVAALMVGLTTTAFAAAYMGLDKAFLKFLNPANEEQAEVLANGAYVVDQEAANENGTINIKQVIGDGNLTYVLMDFTAPEGTVLNAARYRFEGSFVDSEQAFHSTGFKALDDGNPNDNKISLVMSILTEDSLAGQTVKFSFVDLQAADPFPGIFETVIPGTWETNVHLDFKAYSTLYPVDQDITMYGYKAVLKSISVSPISIALKIESGSLKEINEAARGLKEIGENEYLDHYPVTIKYKDGTSETTRIFTGLSLSDLMNGHLLSIKTFENVINDKEIASIEFFDQEIPIR